MHSRLYTELRALSGWPLKQVCGLYLSDPDSKQRLSQRLCYYFAFRGVHVRIWNANYCKTARWTI